MSDPRGGVSERVARSIEVRGVVQGVGFRPFVYRLARAHDLGGWVLNSGEGVSIHVEGSGGALESFHRELLAAPPPAARIDVVSVAPAEALGLTDFEIRASNAGSQPITRISPDLPVCEDCLRELFDPADRRHRYPYINCTNCGPRYSIVLGLPYDRPNTTMAAWPMCEACAAEYLDPVNRRFHAQPTACPRCGPHYALEAAGERLGGDAAVRGAAERLAGGAIVAIKGLGGYHLACDARDARAVAALRERKFRKEKPFALMVRDLAAARALVELDAAAEALLVSAARPIVLAPARVELDGVAPGHHELGVMLAYTPLHHLLFAGGAPSILVMTSANRSDEPIAYRDDEARERLAGIAEAFLIGERPIARRVDDSVARVSCRRPMVLRRARGLTPGVVARIPSSTPLLAVGADLKSSITLVVDGQAYGSQHLGDLADHGAFVAFEETIRDLTSMYEVPLDELVIAHDLHPEYFSTRHALQLPGRAHVAVQHHRAHVASVLAERGEFERRVIGVAFDGTGYGDDGTIWGGEIFAGTLRAGLRRVAHLLPAPLPGGDAAARHPVQAAAGFLSALDPLPDLTASPFQFPERYGAARQLVESDVRTFRTTSAGRLFDTVAALLGFTRPVTYEGQAAIWLEQLARNSSRDVAAYAGALRDDVLDWRHLLAAVIHDRRRGRDTAEIARAFHRGLAALIARAVVAVAAHQDASVAVLSGGVMQNELLVGELCGLLAGAGIEVWTAENVPPNDGGISLGQAAIAAGRYTSA